MPRAAPMPYRDPDSSTSTWVLIFVIASLLLHALLILAILLTMMYFPPDKLNLSTPEVSPEVSLSLQPPPPAMAPPPKQIFMPTQPQQNVKPKNSPIISDNDTNLTSKSKTSRQDDSLMPDVLTKNSHPNSLDQSPSSPSKNKPQPSNPTPPSPQTQQQKAQPTPPQPKPPQIQPKEAQPTQNPSTAPKPPPTPAPTPPPKPVQYDPNGLPVLPALNAPTIAPQTPQTMTQQTQTPIPPPLLPQEAANVQGRAGLSGNPSPEAMATELGRYKAMVYRAVGSRWYQKVGNQLQVLPVGSVHIQFTIYADGTVTTKVLDGGTGTLELLLSVSRNSITEAAPFPPFSPAMQKEVGDSYTDDYTFSIYSGN